MSISSLFFTLSVLPKAEDLKIDSRYNTYLYKGLPPHPISNPGLPAIEATLNPAETDCLFYIHDKDKQTHCAKTYEELKWTALSRQ